MKIVILIENSAYPCNFHFLEAFGQVINLDGRQNTKASSSKFNYIIPISAVSRNWNFIDFMRNL